MKNLQVFAKPNALTIFTYKRYKITVFKAIITKAKSLYKIYNICNNITTVYT